MFFNILHTISSSALIPSSKKSQSKSLKCERPLLKFRIQEKILDHLPPEKQVYKKKEKGDDDKKRGKAKYSGGLVLEPKKGFYTNYILLLDFNSLYPSIIQEYNICFTTTEIHPPSNAESDWLPEITDNPDWGILPTQIRNLVQKRGAVKAMMKTEKNEDEMARLNIRQLGLKLTVRVGQFDLGLSSDKTIFFRGIAITR